MTRKEKKQAEREALIESKGIIALEDVHKDYSSKVSALNGVSLNIKKGEFVFIVGSSGSGKSTLIKLLLRELTASDGEVYVNGYDLGVIKHRQVPQFRRKIGVVFQDFRLLPDRNVFENVAFAQRIIEVPTNEIRSNVPAILTTVGLAGKYKAKTSELSGGEQQRVVVARAIINQPDILLADEPTGNLDYKNSWEVMKLLEEINENGTTVLVVTHNLDIVRKMNKRVIVMKRGVIERDSKDGDIDYSQYIDSYGEMFEEKYYESLNEEGEYDEGYEEEVVEGGEENYED